MSASERNWALGVLALAALGAYLWLIVSLAGVLFGAGWPQIAPSAMPWALFSWVMHPGDPGAGFPRAARVRLPGPVGIYATLVLFTATLTWSAYALRYGSSKAASRLRRVTAAARAFFTEGAGDARAGVRWANARDLRELIVSAPQPGRLTIGRLGGRLIAAERAHSLLVVGPTQSGKTSGLAIPALLEWEGPALATSVKRDLLDVTADARERGGEVWVYDPSPAAGRESCRWNPLENCLTWQGAARMAHWFVSAAQSAPGRNDEARFWTRLGEKLLAPMLFAAAASGLSMADVMHWLDSGEVAEVGMRLERAGSERASDAWGASVGRDERTLSSVYASVEAVLSAYEDPDVLDSTIGDGLSGARLLDERAGTAYICAPTHEQERLAPLFAALVREVVSAAYDRYARTGKPLDPPLLVLLDEAGNIAPIPDLGKLAATAAGVGVQIVSVWHDLAQLHAVYGREAETVVNNHRAKLVLAGVGDERTLRWVQSTLGEQRVAQLSRTRGEQRSSQTESSTFRPLAPPALTRQQRAGEGLLIYGNHAPARIALRPYFRERALQALAKGERARRRRRWRLRRPRRATREAA